MKNIHILPTDKPSRLVKGETTGRLLLHDTYGTSTDRNETQNIYITNDEEIKEGDWLLSKEGIVHNNWGWNFGDKKIILTTDQDLIGVQSIDDEFLEWFVNNPSCENVKIDKAEHGMYKDYVYYKLSNKIFYKIIIPKEEPFKHKVETLEEAAENCFLINEKEGFIAGAKWQQERSYSEEEVRQMLSESFKASHEKQYISSDIILNKFKKK